MSLPGRPRALLLDVGNTLAFLDEEAVARELAARAGVHVAPAALRRAQGPAKHRYERFLVETQRHADGWYVYMESLLAAAGLAPDDAPALARELRTAHDEFNLWRRVPDGLPSALDEAEASGLSMGVVSNSEGAVKELLEAVGLAAHFEVIVDSGVVGISKPDPAIFALALEALDVGPEDALYVGDVPAVDVDGARAAGLEAVLIDTFDHYPDYQGAPKIRAVADLLSAWL